MFVLKLDDKGIRIFEDMFLAGYQKINWRSDDQWREELDKLWDSTAAIKVGMSTYHKLMSTRQALINNPNYMYQNKPSILPTNTTPNGWTYSGPMNMPKTVNTSNTPNPCQQVGNTPNPMNMPKTVNISNSTGNTPYSLSTDMVRINNTEITKQQLYDLLDRVPKPASCATCKGYSPMGMYLIPDSDGPLCDWVCLYFCSGNCKDIYSLTGGVS